MSWNVDTTSLIVAGAVLVLSYLLGHLFRRVLLVRLARLAAATTFRADDAIVDSLGRAVPVWLLLGGLYVAGRIVHVPPQIAPILAKTLLVALILSVTFWVAKLCADLLQPSPQAAPSAVPATGVVRYAVRIVVFIVGGFVLLSNLGIAITPVLTTLGVGGLAVALALQDTLANLFAGMQITLGGSMRVGDFIRLESGEEGFIDDIHWRVTRIRMLPNNFVLIPNSRLAQSIVTNYYQPTRDLAVLVQVGVHYASDLEHVERVTCEAARKIMQTVPGGVPDFEPFIRYHTFADSSINFTVILRGQAFTDNFLIKHEFIKALSRAYAAEGIVIPFPIRAINMDQEKARDEQVIR